MDCERFRRALTALLDRDDDGPEAAAMRDALARHAGECAACRPLSDLVRWLSIPREERDRADDPGPEYFRAFERRVRARIDGEPQPGVATRRAVGILVAAAVIVVAMVGLFTLRDERQHVVTADRAVALVESEPESEPEEVLKWFDVSPWSDLTEDEETPDVEVTDDPWSVPGSERLDPDGRRDFLEWLRKEEDRLRGGAV